MSIPPGGVIVASSKNLVNERLDKPAVEILSFSPCFTLPDDMTPHGDF